MILRYSTNFSHAQCWLTEITRTLYVNSSCWLCELEGDSWRQRSAIDPTKLDICLYRLPLFSCKAGTAMAVPAVPVAPAVHRLSSSLMYSCDSTGLGRNFDSSPLRRWKPRHQKMLFACHSPKSSLWQHPVRHHPLEWQSYGSTSRQSQVVVGALCPRCDIHMYLTEEFHRQVLNLIVTDWWEPSSWAAQGIINCELLVLNTMGW